MEGGLGGVHVPLMSDSNHKISRDYGVLLEDEGVAERALFIIDPKGNIRNITIATQMSDEVLTRPYGSSMPLPSRMSSVRDVLSTGKKATPALRWPSRPESTALSR